MPRNTNGNAGERGAASRDAVAMTHVFLHYEGDETAFTAKVRTAQGMESGLKQFLIKLEAKTGQKFAAPELQLQDDGGCLIDQARWHSLPAKADVFVHHGSVQPPKVVKKAPQKESVKAHASTCENQAKASAIVSESVRCAKEAMSSKNYRKAKAMLEIALEHSPGNWEALWSLAETLRLAGKTKDARREFGRAQKSACGKLAVARAAYGFGLCLSELGQLDEAISALKRAARLPELEADACAALGSCLLVNEEIEEALSVLERALVGRESHAGLVRAYAACARALGKTDEELGLLLRAIVAEPKETLTRRALARALDEPGGCQRLREQLGDASTAAAVAFLATLAKDFGACVASVHLMEWALADFPDSACYALNLVHIREIVADSSRALQVGTDFFRQRHQHRLAGDCLAVLDVLVPEVAQLEWVEPADAGSPYAKVVGYADRALPSPVTYDEDGLDALAIAFAVTKLCYLRGDLNRAASLVAAIEPFRTASAVQLHNTPIRNEHAYYCCLAQILAVDPDRRQHAIQDDSTIFVHMCGDSHALAPAWKRWQVGRANAVLKPVLITGLKHWHLRPDSDFYPKRNFYFALGLETADDVSSPDVASALGLGRVSLEDRTDEFDIVPPGAVVLFVLGEIDCREGILVAVEKLRYRDVEEGIERTVRHFIDAAIAIVRERNYTAAFVHPIPPVLDETRCIVRAYNARLRYHVDQTPELRWLDFFEGLLSPDLSSLNPKYALDGTYSPPSVCAVWDPTFRLIPRHSLLSATGTCIRVTSTTCFCPRSLPCSSTLTALKPRLRLARLPKRRPRPVTRAVPEAHCQCTHV